MNIINKKQAIRAISLASLGVFLQALNQEVSAFDEIARDPSEIVPTVSNDDIKSITFNETGRDVIGNEVRSVSGELHIKLKDNHVYQDGDKLILKGFNSEFSFTEALLKDGDNVGTIKSFFSFGENSDTSRNYSNYKNEFNNVSLGRQSLHGSEDYLNRGKALVETSQSFDTALNKRFLQIKLNDKINKNKTDRELIIPLKLLPSGVKDFPILLNVDATKKEAADRYIRQFDSRYTFGIDGVFTDVDYDNPFKINNKTVELDKMVPKASINGFDLPVNTTLNYGIGSHSFYNVGNVSGQGLADPNLPKDLSYKLSDSLLTKPLLKKGDILTFKHDGPVKREIIGLKTDGKNDEGAKYTGWSSIEGDMLTVNYPETTIGADKGYLATFDQPKTDFNFSTLYFGTGEGPKAPSRSVKYKILKNEHGEVKLQAMEDVLGYLAIHPDVVFINRQSHEASELLTPSQYKDLLEGKVNKIELGTHHIIIERNGTVLDSESYTESVTRNNNVVIGTDTPPGTITVKFIDENGQSIRPDEVIAREQPWFTPYDATNLINGTSFKHFTYIGVDPVSTAGLKGIVGSGTRTVILKYERNAPVVQPIPFDTIYEPDPTLTAGQQVVATEGVNGETTDNIVTTAPINKVIKVGTKPVIRTEPLPKKVIREVNHQLLTGVEKVVREGHDGEIVHTTSYTLGENGQVIPHETTVRHEPENKLIHYGDGELSNVEFVTVYERDDTKPGSDPEYIAREGVKGQINPDGTVAREKVDKLIKVPSGDVHHDETIGYEVVRELDPTMLPGTERVVIEGSDGVVRTTTHYTVDKKTGKKTKDQTTTVTKQPINKVIKYGGGDYTKVPYDKQYVPDGTKPGTESAYVSQKGSEGLRFGDKVIKDKIDEVINVPVKPVVEEVIVKYQTIIRENPKLEKGVRKVVQKGVNGLTKTTTSFRLDTTTGVRTPKTMTETLTTVVDEIVEVGTGENEVIPHTVHYVDDKTLDEGVEIVLMKGEDGLRGPNGEIIKHAKDGLIRRGTKIPSIDPEIPDEIPEYVTPDSENKVVSKNDADLTYEEIIVYPEIPEIEQSVETKTETPIEPKVDQPVEPKVEQPVEQPVEPKVEQPVEQPVETKTETPIEPKVDQPVEPKVEQPVEQPVETKTETPVEPKVDQPVEPKVEPKVDQPVKSKAESKIETPIEPKVDQPVKSKAEQSVKQSSTKLPNMGDTVYHSWFGALLAFFGFATLKTRKKE